jgi:putative sterol carrier protein
MVETIAAPRYTFDWWTRAIAAWNASPEASRLAGFGSMIFRVQDMDVPAVRVTWDEYGQAQVEVTEEPGKREMTATAETWDAYMNGEFNAVQGVFSKRLEFYGDIFSMAPYAGAFDVFASVARDVSS